MLISTRGRYALRVMIDLAKGEGDFIPMKDIAEKELISLKYVEQIVPPLVKNGLIESMHGKGGGYRLLRKPEEYSVGEILRLTEGSLSPVECLEKSEHNCPREGNCTTLPMWRKLDLLLNEFFDGISLRDLM